MTFISPSPYSQKILSPSAPVPVHWLIKGDAKLNADQKTDDAANNNATFFILYLHALCLFMLCDGRYAQQVILFKIIINLV